MTTLLALTSDFTQTLPTSLTSRKLNSSSAELLGPLSDEDLNGIVAELDEVRIVDVRLIPFQKKYSFFI